MNKFFYTLLFILLTTVGYVFAHEDFYATYHYGNVKVRIKTGFEYEEISKVAMLGKLAEKMCEELNYSKPVLLDYVHQYTGRRKPAFFISYDNINTEYLGWGTSKNKNHFWDGNKVVTSEIGDFLEGDAIVIRQFANKFQSHTTLKLLEYAILNLNHIKATQTRVEYNAGYRKWTINSLDTSEIKRMLSISNSELLKKVSDIRVDRPEKDSKQRISYYLKNGRYFLFLKEYNGDTPLLDVDNIFDIKKIGISSAIIFDSDSSFYYVDNPFYHTNGKNNYKISKRHIIKERGGSRPFKIVDLGGRKIAIMFSHFTEWKDKEDDEYVRIGDRTRTLIYSPESDRLIQDLDKILEKETI